MLVLEKLKELNEKIKKFFMDKFATFMVAYFTVWLISMVFGLYDVGMTVSFVVLAYMLLNILPSVITAIKNEWK